MTSLTIVTADAFVARADEWRKSAPFRAIDDEPIYGAFGRSYYPAVYGEARTDVSFAIVEGETPLVIVPCARGEGVLDHYGAPIRLFWNLELPEGNAQRAIAAAFAQLDALAAEYGGSRRVNVCDDGSLGRLSLVGKQCLNRKAEAALRLSGLCDLSGGDSRLRRTLRKSFQSLINWGRRNLKLVSVDAGNPDAALFTQYRDFHAAVAGRVTRSDASWQAMYAWIAAGNGELVLGFLETGELVTGTMVADGARQSFYASGVYDRNRFDLPLAHWPLWAALLHSAERGKALFELGDLPLADAANEKEVAIGYFKRGFATEIKTWIAWSWMAENRVGAASK